MTHRFHVVIQWVLLCSPGLALAQSSGPALVVAAASTDPVPLGQGVSEFPGDLNERTLPFREPEGASSGSEGMNVADSLWLNGLVGTWEGQVRGERYVETWTCANNACNGRAVSFSGADEAFVEHTRIFNFHGQWLYLVAAGDSPVVCFVRASADATTWVFSNSEHDFPQRISYSQDPVGQLNAFIEGPGKEGVIRLEFNLTRKF